MASKALKARAATSTTTRRSSYRPPLSRLPEERAILIQVCPKIDGIMNHTYRDYARIPVSPSYVPPPTIDDMSFSQKVHAILSNPSFETYISWMPHGRGFKVHCPAEFERDVCPVYFSHGRYSSFLRSLDNYGFKHISKGTDRNTYYHELMLRGRPHLCQFMPRCRDARRLAADPNHEPDFYAINRMFGAPDGEPTARAVAPPVLVTPSISRRAATPSSTSSSAASLPSSTNDQSTAAATLLAALVPQVITTTTTTTPSPPPTLEATTTTQNPQQDLACALLAALLAEHFTLPAPTPKPPPPKVDPAVALLASLVGQKNNPSRTAPPVQTEEDLVKGVLLGALLLQQYGAQD